MRAPQVGSTTFSTTADAVFQAALGVAQGDKSARVLAVHNEGRRVIFRMRAKMSNPKFHQVWVEAQAGATTLHAVVGSDPRSPGALLDGWANGKALKKYLAAVQSAVDGTSPAPATPVPNHYLQKKAEVAWTDPHREPEIELDGGCLALYSL